MTKDVVFELKGVDLVRTLLGSLFFGALWFLIGSALLSWSLGFVLGLWSLVVGPIFLILFSRVFFLFIKKTPLGNRLYPLIWAEAPILAREYFEKIPLMQGLKLRVWVLPSSEIFYCWWEALFVPSGRQEIIISSRTLQRGPSELKRDFQLLWQEMSMQSRSRRRWRSIQIALWFGACGPFEIILLFLGFILKTPFSAFPAPGVWVQSLFLWIKEFWFGRDMLPEVGASLFDLRHGERVLKIPQSFQNVLWAPWTRYPSLNLHVIWEIMLRRKSVI